MNTISEDHRQILDKVCIKGKRYAEVSEELGIPVGTVRSRLSRARASLQEALDTPHVQEIIPAHVQKSAASWQIAA
jgi:RNA polymerase sigma-70 factor (ECF subfamily)